MAPRKKIEPTSSFDVKLWTLEQVEPTLAAYNPRLISEQDLDKLMQLISKFGFLLPVIINQRTSSMVGGHQRFKAAKKLDLVEIPVHLVDLDETQEKVLNLALNKIEGRWDYALLEQALNLSSEADLLTFSGFDESDMIEFFSEQDSGNEETFEGFADRMSNRNQMPYVTFRSDQVWFNCSKADYELLVQRIYSDTGIDDTAASDRFFELIGLGDVKAA